MKPRRVLQQDATGCGIACAAMIAGVSYAYAKAIAIELGLIEKSGSQYTTSRKLIRLLAELDVIALTGRKLKHWESVDCLSIVGINYRPNHEIWHWVVYVPDDKIGYVLDPRRIVKSSKRVDFTRMRPRSYIPVTHSKNSY